MTSDCRGLLNCARVGVYSFAPFARNMPTVHLLHAAIRTPAHCGYHKHLPVQFIPYMKHSAGELVLEHLRYINPVIHYW